MDPTIPRLHAGAQALLSTLPVQYASSSGFTQRPSLVSAAVFVQTLVFGLWSWPTATLRQLATTAGLLGVPVSPQALDARCGPAAVRLVRAVLEAAIAHMLTGAGALRGAAPPHDLLRRFTRVILQDSTTIALPAALATDWPGCGNGSQQPSAALKVHIGWDLVAGGLSGLTLTPSRVHDRTQALDAAAIGTGALWLADLAYFDGVRLAAVAAADGYFLTRIPAQTLIVGETVGWDGEDARWHEVPSYLAQVTGDAIDQPIVLAKGDQLPARLVAVRADPTAAADRRRKLHADAKRKGRTPSARILANCDWTVYATNLPLDLANAAEVLVLARLRWQVELVFKQWKGIGHLDAVIASNPWRTLLAILARLLALLLSQWLAISTAGPSLHTSRTAVADLLSHCALVVLLLWDDPALLDRLIDRLTVAVTRLAISTRGHRAHHQLLAPERQSDG